MTCDKNDDKEIEILQMLSNAVQSKEGNIDLFSPQRRAVIETLLEERSRKKINQRDFGITIIALLFSFGILLLAYFIDRGNPDIDAFSKVLPGALSVASLAIGSYLGRGSSFRKSESLSEK